MRVLFINRYYAPDQSGTSRMLTELAQDLARSGARVSVVASDGDSERPIRRHPPQETLDGVAVYRAPTWLRLRRIARGTIRGWVLNSLSFYPMALLYALHLPRHDVVVLMSDPPLLHLLGLPLRWCWGCRVVSWCQDLYPEMAVATGVLGERSIAARLLGALSRWGLSRADHAVAIGEVMAERLGRAGLARERIDVIHNWADGGRIFPVPAERNDFAREHRLDRSFVALYSGNMGVGHHFHTIVEAARRLQARRDITFLFIGEGKRRAWLAHEARDVSSVRFLPPQPDAQLACSLSAGAAHLVTLQPGLEGVMVPSKLYSALAAGRPVIFIGPPASEAARLIEKAACGYIVAPGDVGGCAAALTALADSPEAARRLGENGRRYFDEHLDRRLAAERFSGLLGRVRCSPVRPSAPKRLFDVALSGAGLLLSAPLWAAIAALIRLEDGGPVFFRDRRVGQGGREFDALKFRTMVPDADRTFGPLQARAGDPRVTRMGRLLRATAMDELPQLWNIFTGDMSFVGPRALRPVEVEARAASVGAMSLFEIPGAGRRLAVRPGLTGLAQIHAPRDLIRRHKFRYDLLYIRRSSFWLDLRLILTSFWITVTGSWERPTRPLWRKRGR
ncbi:MAG: sugar transferase [Nitrospirota bacterium]